MCAVRAKTGLYWEVLCLTSLPTLCRIRRREAGRHPDMVSSHWRVDSRVDVQQAYMRDAKTYPHGVYVYVSLVVYIVSEPTSGPTVLVPPIESYENWRYTIRNKMKLLNTATYIALAASTAGAARLPPFPRPICDLPCPSNAMCISDPKPRCAVPNG